MFGTTWITLWEGKETPFHTNGIPYLNITYHSIKWPAIPWKTKFCHINQAIKYCWRCTVSNGMVWYGAMCRYGVEHCGVQVSWQCRHLAGGLQTTYVQLVHSICASRQPQYTRVVPPSQCCVSTKYNNKCNWSVTLQQPHWQYSNQSTSTFQPRFCHWPETFKSDILPTALEFNTHLDV